MGQGDIRATGEGCELIPLPLGFDSTQWQIEIVFIDFSGLFSLPNYSKVKEGGNGLFLLCAGTCWDS